jgi:hypothetical protein
MASGTCSQAAFPPRRSYLVQFVPTNKPIRAKGGRPKESGNKPAPLANKPAPVAVVEPVQQTKLAEQREDDLPKEREQGLAPEREVERYKALARFYKACASFESMCASYFEGRLLGAADRQSRFAKQLEQRLSENQWIAEEAAEVEAAYAELAEKDADAEFHVSRARFGGHSAEYHPPTNSTT